MNIKLIGLNAAVILGLMTPPAFAARYIACDSCTGTQMENAALQSGVGRVLVGNVNTNSLVAFRVYLAPQPQVIGQQGPPAQHRYVDADEVSSEESSAFSELTSFYKSIPTGYHKQFNLRIVPAGQAVGLPDVARSHLGTQSNVFMPESKIQPFSEPAPGGGTINYPTPGTNVYDVINSGPKQNAFLSWLDGVPTYSISSILTSATKAASVLHITDTSNMPTLSFTITFEDGSHIGAYVDFSQQPPQLVINENSGVDSHGNNVPATKSAVAGSGVQKYNFGGRGNNTDRGNMRQQLGFFGIDPPASIEWACTRIDKDTIHCIPVGAG